MNILLFSPVIPYPLHDGLRLRIFNFFKELGARHQVDLLCFVDNEMKSDECLTELKGLFRSIQMVRHTPSWENKHTGYEKVKDFFYFRINLHCESNEMCAKLTAAINNNTYDLICCVGMDLIPYLDKCNKLPVVVDMVDSLSLPLYRDFRISKNIIEKVRSLKRLYIFQQREKKYLRGDKKVIVVSQKDADSIRKSCFDIRPEIIPNGVDVDYFMPNQILGNEQSLLFTGVMNFPPNVQAMLYFTQSIFPQLQKHCPNIILNITGKSPSAEIIQLNSSNKKINVTGFVEDIRPYFDKSSIFICPMISGTGIKNKILEAFAMKKAVVATALACEGIEVTHGKHLLIAKDTKEFINFVINLLKDDKLRQDLGENARSLVENKYSWKSQADKLDNLLKEITTKNI